MRSAECRVSLAHTLKSSRVSVIVINYCNWQLAIDAAKQLIETLEMIVVSCLCDGYGWSVSEHSYT